MERRISAFLGERASKGLLRDLTEMTPLAGGKVLVGDREYINFSSNDYLGLSAHPEIVRASAQASSPFAGIPSSRLMSGSTPAHRALEDRVAGFKKKPAALVFNSGYQANVGIINAVVGKGDCIFSDRLNHASIVDGIRLSGARMFRFRHNDVGHLEELLKKERDKYAIAVIVTETVFSMDGDLAPIEELCRLKRKYDCTLMVDEAHATGVFGARGGGLLEEKGMEVDADIVMGTFGKALGVFGAYAAVSCGMKEYLVNTCRSFIYSTALPRSIVEACRAAIDVAEREGYRRDGLLSNARYFREALRNNGWDVRGDSQIVPVVTGDNATTLRLSSELRGKGYWVTPVRPPTVPRGEARLRISITFDHARETLDGLIGGVGSV